MKQPIILALAVAALVAAMSGCALRGASSAIPTRIHVTSDGTVVIAERLVAADAAGASLRSLRVPVHAPIVVIADREAPYRHVVPVLEGLQRAGYARISFSAR